MPRFYDYRCDSCDFGGFLYCNRKRCHRCGGDLIRIEPIPTNRPTIVCLVGHRLDALFIAAYQEEAAAQKLIISTISYEMVKDSKFLANAGGRKKSAVRDRLKELSRQAINLADEVLVLNRGGCLDEEVIAEIRYAFRAGKRLRFWEVIGEERLGVILARKEE